MRNANIYETLHKLTKISYQMSIIRSVMILKIHEHEKANTIIYTIIGAGGLPVF